MAFVNEITTSISDFITKLHTFATANGWTGDQLDTGAGKMAISKNPSGATKVFISFRWDTASPASVGIYNALAFDGVGTDPGNHTDDSGNGKVSGTDATLATGRRLNLSTLAEWWGFEDSNYLHFVVLRTDGTYIHGGFGQISKIGDWTGGEYAYGFKHKTGVTSNVAISDESTVLLDALAATSNIEDFVATMHVEGLQNQQGGGSGKWGVIVGNHSTFDNDRAAVARTKIVGGFRGGPLQVPFGRFGQDTSKGLQPMIPILNWYVDTSTTDTHPLGWMKDTRLFNGEFWTGGALVVVGGVTWQVFPTLVKGSSGALINTSGHQFIAYKQVT